MVFVNDKKYACETCIKGHRSSTCNHHDRPLFEIKKKGRPITQCEHCRELRKTKQVHVKCICEGKEDLDAVSHSIPAKKANRKGPVPSAAFPHGLQSASDSDEASAGPSQSKKAAQRIDGRSSACACKAGGACECCTPRHPPRTKRSPTPPRPKVGDIRVMSRPPSESDDTSELPGPNNHYLMHGHGARSTHGTGLFNPYGLAHDMHVRSHDMRGHEVSTSVSPVSLGSEQALPQRYTYPVLTLPYDQQQEQSFSIQSEVSPTWPGAATISEDLDNMLAAFDTRDSLRQLESSFESVDVDAWLRQMNSSSNSSGVDSSVPSASTSTSTSSFVDSQQLPIPQALDLSGTLAQEQDYATTNHFSLLPQFIGFDVNINDQLLSGSDHGVSDADGIGSGANIFDPGLLNFSSAAVHEVITDAPELPAPTPFPTFPALTSSSFGTQLASGSADGDAGASADTFDFLTAMVDSDPVALPIPGVPALSRSSSTGSHSSSRSRSSLGGGPGAGDSGLWHHTYDAPGRGGSWSLFPFATAAVVTNRGRPPVHARAMPVLPGSKDGGIPSLSFN